MKKLNACDDGKDANDGHYNGCKEDCTLGERCGDGVKNGTEECDDGADNGVYGKCNALCTGVGDYCGDGVKNGEEACDDGENNGKYGYCNTDCSGLGERCGDAVIQKAVCELPEEETDADAETTDAETTDTENTDTENTDTDTETTDTDPAEPEEMCVVNELANEDCDEGELNGVYGHCNAECTSLMVCGDGVVQDFGGGNEICDGNTKSCKEIAPVFSAESEALCSECSSWDESTCQCAEYYSGNGCLSCDGAHFCNGHGTCTADRTGKTTCSCTDHFTGPTCNECEEKYHLNDAGTKCIEDCHSSCGQASFLINPASHGHCDYSGEKGVCVCDPCWMTTGVALVLPTFETPECAQYTPNVPGC